MFLALCRKQCFLFPNQTSSVTLLRNASSSGHQTWCIPMMLYSCRSSSFPLLCTWFCWFWCMINICEFVPGTSFCLLSAPKGADGVLRWRAENSCPPARMKQRDREVQIKIILPTDPSADSRVLLYCYHGDWNRKEVKLLQNSAGSSKAQAETQTSD